MPSTLAMGSSARTLAPQASLLFCHSSPIYWIVGLYMTVVGGLTVGMFFSPEKTRKVRAPVGGVWATAHSVYEKTAFLFYLECRILQST